MTTKPHEFGTMNCGDGITIVKPGLRYEVHRDGRFARAADSLYEATKIADSLKGEIGSLTKTTAGHEITLEAGVRYIAVRPMCEGGSKLFNVYVERISDGKTASKISGLTYDQANELLNAFNNGPTSFEGRVWE